uniref:Lon protease n=1 Tax=Candidatus Methanogaster sp. ANME-2c ERB4 TaxID=2759911 RepID=A0A7G9Y8B7_9EURY|nr:Lon protease [Methanosarcinales archaeon ANME-2c ERB4]QNO44742.1 Lon protease [Methanosarcinales archaeon ANME-2c ERB4]
MEKKRLILILLILPILLSCTLCTSAAPVSVMLPAVYSSEEIGVLANLTVWVTDGTGHVFVDTKPFAQVDMQGSARLSSMVACDITGTDSEAHDFFYVIHANSPVIGGPSAGAAMTVATVAALENWTVDPGVVMTGMINPDGSIGAVGGIPAKLNVSVRHGAHTFLIPPGQGNITEIVQVIEQDSPSVTIIDELVTTNVIELGSVQGVEVREIDDIRDAVYAYTGNEIPRIILTGEVQTPEYLDAMQPLALALLDESRAQYNETDAIVDQGLKDAFDSQIQAIADAQNDYDMGNYYASMSRSFNTMIKLRRIGWYSLYLESDDKDEYLSNLTGCVEDEIADAELAVSEARLENGVLEGIGAAESRLTIAKERLDWVSHAENADDVIYLLAFAMERARSAKWWATLSCVGGGAEIPEDLLKDRAGRYYSQSASMLAYAEMLTSEAGGDRSWILDATDDLSRARRELRTGYYAGAIYDSLHAMVIAGTAIELIGIADIDEKVNNSERAAMSAILSAREGGAEPILATSAYEHAEILAASDTDRIVDYGYAKMVARTARFFACQDNRTAEPGTGEIRETVDEETAETAETVGPGGYWVLTIVAAVYLIRRRCA